MKVRLTFLLTLLVSLIFLVRAVYQLSDRGELTVNFLDVGQGDSIIITTPRGGKILIDGGRDNLVLERLGRTLNIFDKQIDLVVATHDDLDHVGGLPAVIDRYQVDTLLTSLASSTGEAMQAVVASAEAKEVKIINANHPQIINTADGVQLQILFPTQDMNGAKDSNSASVVARVVYGETSFLLTGDLAHAGELYLVSLYGDKLKSNVLKLGHHGSDSSTHPSFLETVGPSAVVVSAGKNNSFGHPHQSVVDLLNKFGVQIFSTAEEGNVVFKTDGLSVWRD
jgi:competence protein ComEC